jgi:hypothetical protein
MNSLDRQDEFNDDKKKPEEHSFFDDLRKELDTSFPLSGGETDEDFREAIGEEDEEDNDTFQKAKPVTYPLNSPKRIEEMTDEDKLDDDVPPKNEWRGF